MTNLAEQTDILIKELMKEGKPLRAEKRKAPECVVELVTPDTARRYLTANCDNRDIRETRVIAHAAALRQHEWRLTCNGIGFDTNGRLIDGQHRLCGVAVGGVSAPMVVVRGLEPEAQDVMDTNLPRRLGDALKLRKEKNWNILAAALKWSWRYDFIEATGEVHYGNLGLRPNTPQMLKYLDENPSLRECVSRVSNVANEVPVRRPLFSALWLRMSYVDEEAAGRFVNILMTGLEPGEDGELHPVGPGHPIYALRRILTQDRLRNHEKMPDYREAALISKAWNLWINGDEIGTLSWHYGPLRRQPFPIIRGPRSEEEERAMAVDDLELIDS